MLIVAPSANRPARICGNRSAVGREGQAQRACVIVSMRAGVLCSLTTFRPLASAGRTASGSRVGPSPYRSGPWPFGLRQQITPATARCGCEADRGPRRRAGHALLHPATHEDGVHVAHVHAEHDRIGVVSGITLMAFAVKRMTSASLPGVSDPVRLSSQFRKVYEPRPLKPTSSGRSARRNDV